MTPQALRPDRQAGVLRVQVDSERGVNPKPGEDDPPVVGLRDVAVELAKWYRDGTAAGNHGDFYDNRDRGHSMMRLNHFPQFTRIIYSDPLRQKNLDYGVQVQLLYNRVVLGNSSTAMTRGLWRSNARRLYVDGRAMALLHQQYTSNHLYIYPEHRDYDTGHNGLGGGYGDVFPTNTPYVLISRGSSGSDRPLLDAVGCTLAAFRPNVKSRLIEHGLLMPTVQMIFRWCYDDVNGADDYLTGKAHPTVFDGSKIHRRAMVQMAHAITPLTIPPMVRLAVVDETPDRPGEDYFEGGPAQKLATTPQTIARVHRTMQRDYRITLSAAASSDVNNRPLTYHWAVLRGNAEAITIKPLNDDGSRVEVVVPWQDRRPIAPGAAMQSNRVDIGAFVSNGVHHSAPAFVTIATLDDESRVYDEAGRIFEVDYNDGVMDLSVTDWPGLLRQIADPQNADDAAPGPPLLHEHLTDPQREALAAAADEYAEKSQAHKETEQTYQQANTAWREARKTLKEIKNNASGSDRQAALEAAHATEQTAREQRRAMDKKRDALLKARDQVLSDSRFPLGGSVRAVVEALLQAMLDRTTLSLDLADRLEKLLDRPEHAKAASRIRSKRDRLVEIGLIDPEPPASLVSVRPGDAPIQQRLTPYERSQLKQFNGQILDALLFEGLVEVRFVADYVDPMIASCRTWRDVYRYTDQGQRIGWTRYTAQGPPQQFTADGARVLATDSLGRPTRARTVTYELAPMKSPGRRTLVQKDGDTILTYTYVDDQDQIGAVASRSPVK